MVLNCAKLILMGIIVAMI